MNMTHNMTLNVALNVTLRPTIRLIIRPSGFQSGPSSYLSHYTILPCSLGHVITLTKCKRCNPVFDMVGSNCVRFLLFFVFPAKICRKSYMRIRILFLNVPLLEYIEFKMILFAIKGMKRYQ